MNSAIDQPRSPAVKASWASLGLALGCSGLFIIFTALDGVAPFAHTGQGVLTGLLPRTLLYLLWAGEALAVVVGGLSFLLIRRPDLAARSVPGIIVRSLCGFLVGLPGVLILWLYVGHRVIGF